MVTHKIASFSGKKVLTRTLLGGIVLLGSFSPAATLSLDQTAYVQAATIEDIPYKTLFNGKEVHLGVNVQKTSKGFMIPLRGVFERLGGKISTASGTKVMVKSGSKVLTVTRGSTTANINGQTFTLAEPVATINGNTMVSVEAVTKLFPNLKVTSSSATKKINFTYGAGSEAVLKNGMPARPAKKPGPYSWSIDMYYGSHTYASTNQAEYDAVMNEVEKTLASVDFTKLNTADLYLKGVESYLNGARYVGDPAYANREERYIGMAELSLKSLVNSGVSKEEIIKLVNLSIAVSTRIGDSSTAVDNRINSAYHVLITKQYDCDSYAQALSAFYDRMGYSTAIHATTNHASGLVKINGKWYNVDGGTFQETTVTDATFVKDPSMFLVKPTY
ncbi:copper amine oxidase N-terminal domain-containing protein [Domibacillus sp. A3M-37]|uniref:stalk domain-containing protein n=1 Tax=Domibacillus sp. A3M-37 TaxID=2962037 RepID=UPI0020B85501|nr:copper amine oxidase N-terminal domain-containing protein [Domibacillus sp. A3M-37]MCP3763685.1 copper amine oxidase N-terminal domain-containing protein [Domibacillus sp. A3M-37]